MTARTAKLMDSSGNVVAIAQVSDEGDHLGGSVDLRQTPDRVRVLFEEFEEIVSTQTFSLLDAIQEKIAALLIRAVFDDGLQVEVKDLQVYPSSGDVSFKYAGRPIHNGCLPSQEVAPKR